MEERMNTTEAISRYFPGLSDAPYADDKEQLLSWATFVELVVALSFDANDHAPETFFECTASYMADLPAEALYAPRPQGDTPLDDELAYLFDVLIVKGHDEDGGVMYPMAALLLALDTYEKWLVILTFVAGTNAKYRRLLGLLQKSGTEPAGPSAQLAADLARFFIREDEILREPAEWSQFMRQLFVPAEENDYLENGLLPLVLEPTVRAFLSGKISLGSARTGGISDDVTSLLPAEEEGYIAQERLYHELVCTLRAGGRSGVLSAFAVELCGAQGSGRRYLLSRAAGECGRRVLAVDAGRLLSFLPSKREAAYRDIRLKCTLFDYILYLYRLPQSAEDDNTVAKEMLAALMDASVPAVIGTEEGLSPHFGAASGVRLRKLEIPHPKAGEQRLLWQSLAKEAGFSFPSEDTISELVSKYTLNPGRIADALFAVTLMMPEGDSRVLDIPLLEEQIRRLSAADFGDTATKLSSPFTFDDLIVGEKSRHLLELAVSRIRHTATVNDSFGFGRKLPYGRGVAIVLYGPPGTGKTMAAQVIAKELNLDIYRVDLSQISSKYIGETEKNLGAVFDAATNSNAILFFDEADALFSKRTNVSTSNDKHANAETAYLLQKVEEYEGVSILATNNMNNFDAAFKRRMTFLIPVEAPDEATRVSLWQSVFPAEAPVDPAVDFALLAKTFELTGAQIKAIAITSAYLAADAGCAIGYEQLIEAADMECAKAGQLNAGELLRTAIFSAM